MLRSQALGIYNMQCLNINVLEIQEADMNSNKYTNVFQEL